MRPPEPQPVERRQLDLFVDGHDALLIHEIVTSLVLRDAHHVETGLARLYNEDPSHPDLPALTLLAETLQTAPAASSTHATLTARVERMERDVTAAARRFLATGSATFLRPLWQTLAATAAGLPFDDTHPSAHAGWLFQQCDDWAAVRGAVEAEPDWAAKPVLRYWLGLSRHRLGAPEAAIRLWLPLCWIDPVFFARQAPTLPNATIRVGWETFERTVPLDEVLSDTTHAATWFPAWLLVRHRGLGRLFRADDIPDAGTAARAFAALLPLVPLEGGGLSDDLVAGAGPSGR
jgi:hypothetical protein